MSILKNKIRWWWIEKSVNDNIPTAAVFEAFQPTVKNGPDREWIRVISLDDFHKEAGMNITRWVEVCQDLVNAKQIVKNQLSRVERQAEDIKQLESEKASLAREVYELSEKLFHVLGGPGSESAWLDRISKNIIEHGEPTKEKE